MFLRIFFVFALGLVWAQPHLLAAETNSSFASDSLSGKILTIRFFDDVKVENPQILLGDIAEIRGEFSLVERLRHLPVAQSAHFGLSRLLDADRIYADYLKPLAKRYQIGYEPKIIRVRSEAQVLHKDSLLQLIHVFIADTSGLHGGRRDFEIVNIPDSIFIPLTPATLRIQFASKRQKGKVDFYLAIEKDYKIIRKIPFTLNVRLFEKVIVAKEKIPPGTLLTQDLISEEFRETTLLAETPLNTAKSILGAVTKQTLIPGRIILPRLLTLVPVVRRGQQIKLQYSRGNFKITADGISRQDGIPGQIISAKNLVTQKLVRCKVHEQGFLEPLDEGRSI